MYGVNAEATKRLGGAVTQLWTLGGEWYGNKTEQQSSGYDNCPVIRPGTPAPFGPRACDMLHTNQADVPQSKGSQWAMWVQDEFGFADGRYTLTPALRYDHYKQKPESTDSYASNPNAGKLPSANSAGRFSPSCWPAGRRPTNSACTRNTPMASRRPARPSSTPTTAAPAPICAWAIPT